MADSRTVDVRVLVISLAVAAIATVVAVWLLTAPRTANLEAALTAEASRTADLTAQVTSLTASASDAASATQAALASAAQAAAAASASAAVAIVPPGTAVNASLTTYAYVRSVSGPLSGTFIAYIDPFQIYTGSAAVKYAKDHKLTLPSNGILFVNDSLAQSPYPLAETVKITAYTGSVGAMTPLVIPPTKLQAWASDHTVVPGAVSDMWQVTVKSGVITTVKMIAIAG